MKKLVFLTGTRADFGKIKSLMTITQNSPKYEVHIFITGMHMNPMYGDTYEEIEKSGFKNLYKYVNHNSIDYMDRNLAKTIDGFSLYIEKIKPDLIVVHGDRVEALAGAIVGSLNNILVSHIEGGELSGTIDELIRHSVSKMSHIHLVSNEKAKKRLLQLGEYSESVFVLGSPDLDLMNEEKLPDLKTVKNYYDINFDRFAIAMFHPITTEYDNIQHYTNEFFNAIVESNKQYILIYPNNDLGSEEIIKKINSLKGNDNIKIFPSLRFEYFLRFLKDADYIIGNSSAGIREAPHFNTITIDVGTRQKNRAKFNTIINTGYQKDEILKAIKFVSENKIINEDLNNSFGDGNSDKMFLDLLDSNKFWNIKFQKQFQDIY